MVARRSRRVSTLLRRARPCPRHRREARERPRARRLHFRLRRPLRPTAARPARASAEEGPARCTRRLPRTPFRLSAGLHPGRWSARRRCDCRARPPQPPPRGREATRPRALAWARRLARTRSSPSGLRPTPGAPPRYRSRPGAADVVVRHRRRRSPSSACRSGARDRRRGCLVLGEVADDELGNGPVTTSVIARRCPHALAEGFRESHTHHLHERGFRGTSRGRASIVQTVIPTGGKRWEIRRSRTRRRFKPHRRHVQ
jgi:hypothetical protein